MIEQSETSYNVGLGIWFCFCVLLSMWMFSKFMKGKQQLYSNLHVVEDSLLKMQEKMELAQRKKSMGYVENLDDLTAGLMENNSNICEQAQNEAENDELMKTAILHFKHKDDLNKLSAERRLRWLDAIKRAGFSNLAADGES